MGNPAARMGDLVLQTAPHCHAPIHPPAPVPTPVPHPAMPLAIVKGVPTVLISNMPAATATSTTLPCTMIPCVPGGPGMVAVGFPKILIGSLPCARVGDDTLHSACVAPIPSPAGKILPPGAPTVLLG